MERISDTKNNVGVVISPGRGNPKALSTVNTSAYRHTSDAQIKDIIECGYVRYKDNGKYGKIVNWGYGGENVFYIDEAPVLEVDLEVLRDQPIGAISLDQLSAIWMFDKSQNKYVNKIQEIRMQHQDIIDNQDEQQSNGGRIR